MRNQSSRRLEGRPVRRLDGMGGGGCVPSTAPFSSRIRTNSSAWATPGLVPWPCSSGFPTLPSFPHPDSAPCSAPPPPAVIRFFDGIQGLSLARPSPAADAYGAPKGHMLKHMRHSGLPGMVIHRPGFHVRVKSEHGRLLALHDNPMPIRQGEISHPASSFGEILSGSPQRPQFPESGPSVLFSSARNFPYFSQNIKA